jgi:hypothetical protein
MANVNITCGIDGCEASWSVKPAAMKKTLEEHRRTTHPGWEPPQAKPMDMYRLDYSRRGRQL